MSKFGLHNQHVEIPFREWSLMFFLHVVGLWSLLTDDLFMPPLNDLCINSIDFVESSISPQGNLSEIQL